MWNVLTKLDKSGFFFYIIRVCTVIRLLERTLDIGQPTELVNQTLSIEWEVTRLSFIKKRKKRLRSCHKQYFMVQFE